MKKVLSKKPLLKRKKVKPLSYWQKKCDRLIQEAGRRLYNKCLICGGEYSCLHHFVLRSQSSFLRYNMKNLIPVCVKCHCSIHQGANDLVVGRIITIKGKEWLEEIEKLKNQGRGMKFGRLYYEEKFKRLSLLNPYKV